MSDDDDIESSPVYCRYEADCPHCGGVNDFGDIDPTGDAVRCDDCGERFKVR